MKENQTWIQVFGDLKQGNGDPTLTLFGREVAPNQHALAEQFVLLDNCYAAVRSLRTASRGRRRPMPQSHAACLDAQLLAPRRPQHEREHRRAIDAVRLGSSTRQKGLSVKTFGMGNRRGIAEVRSARFDQRPSDPQLTRARDYERAEVSFVEEFQEMDRAGAVPNFMFMSLGENHASGTAPGAYTPKAQVAFE